MILHIALDDKFVPFLQGIFEEASPDKSLWRVLSDKPTPSFALPTDFTETINGSYFHSARFKSDLDVADCLIFHSLTLTHIQKALVLALLPRGLPIVWRGWGFDYYGYLEANGKRLMLPETMTLCEKPSALQRILSRNFPEKLLKRVIAKLAGRAIDSKFLGRVDFFSCCVPDDHEDLRQALPKFSAKFVPLNYYSKEDVFLRGDDGRDLSGNDILLGNSATPSNNHIEAMRLLSGIGMQGRKVIVPLSYGDMKYQRKILQAGEELLGHAFVPLTSYMSLADYNQTVSGCGNLVMNHVRQQAMGNISAALLRGGKVFLRPENPIYKHYSGMGVKLFALSEETGSFDFDAELNRDDASKNREIMSRIWARKQAIENVKAIALLRRQL